MVLIIRQIKITVLQAIKVGSGSKEKMGFKRSKHLEKKLKVGFVCACSGLIICVWLLFRGYLIHVLKFVLFVCAGV